MASINPDLDQLGHMHAQLEKLLRGRRDADRITDLVARMGWAHVRLGAEWERQRIAKDRARAFN